MRKTIPILLATLLACSAAFAQQAGVAYTENFQSYGKNKNPNGWVDTSIGGSAANGLYKTDIDPTQGNKGTNIVFGTRQSSGRPDGNTPRIGTFSHLTTHNFSTSGRFEYTGRFIRTNSDTRIGFSFCSSYPQQDKYYMVALWSRPAGGVTLQLHAFGAGTPAGRLDSNLTPDVNRWYRFRIQADDLNNQTQIRARFWQDGAPEPTTWSIDAADSAAARLKTGRIGIWSAVKGDFYVDDLSANSPVDHIAPVISLYESDKLLDPAVITPVNHNAILEAKVLDDISGVGTITMKVDGLAYTPRTPVTVEGLHTVRADAVDNVGNASFLEAKVLVDKTAPVVVFTEGTRTLDATRLETFKFDPKIGIAVTDNVSTFTWAATLDGQPYVPGTPITTDAFHNLRVVATDQAQNVTDVTLRILVDKVAPVVVFSESDNVLDPSRLETFKVDPKIVVKVTDATSQVTTVITLNGQPYVSGTPIAIDAFYDLRVVATDQAGNVTDLTQKLLVDKLPPVIKFSAGGSILDPASGVHEFDENVGIKVEVTDATSRATTTITLDGQPYVSETPITADGFHELRVIAVDEAGNSTDLTLKILIDKQPPVVVFSESGNTLDPTKTATFARDAKIVITVTDATSETESTFTLDTQPYVSGTAISAEGFHDVRVVAKDESNNVTDRTLRVLVDKTRPTIEVFESNVKLDPAVTQKFRRNATIDIVVKDAISTATYTATLDGTAYTSGTPIATEATHRLVVNAIDEAGNTAELEIEIHVDKTAPVVKFSESGALLDTTKITRFKQDIHVDIDVTDNLPGVTYTAEISSPSGVQPYTSGALIHADGRHTITVNAIDVAGNPIETKVELLIDQTGPVIEFREGTRTLETDVRQEFNHLPAITIVVTDGLTTPTHTAKLDGNDFTSGATVAEGKHSLVVVATDELGNPSESKLDMLVDKTAPVVVLKVGDAVLPAAGAIFNRNIKVDAHIDDISETTTVATLNGNPFDLADTITEEREHDLSVTVTDELDWPATKTAKFFVDKTAPKISVFESAEGLAPLADEKAFARQIKITATAEDLTPYTLTATIDGTLYTFGTPYDVDGPHVLVVNGVDSAGNHSEPITLRFFIDKSKPEVTLFESGEPFPVGKTFTRDVIVTIEVRSATATTRTAKIDGQPYTLGQPFAAEGRHEIEVVVTNVAQLPTTEKATFTIDKTNPTIQLFANGQPWQQNMKFGVDVTVTATAQDNLAAAPKKKILLDDQEIADGYVVSREDFHKISATVTDDGGLPGETGPFDFVLDKTMPEVTVTVLVDGVAKPLVSGNKFAHAITPEITIDDLTATTFTATLAANEGTPQAYTKGTEISEDARYSLVISVRDDLGNNNPLPAITFIIDKTPPVVIVKERDVTFEGGQFDRNVTPVVEIQDLTQTTTTATLDGEQWSSGVEITEDGAHVLNVTVTDDLGNSMVVPPISFTIDKSDPVVTVTERGDVLADGALFSRDVQPKITVTDTTAADYAATLNGETFHSEDLVTAERKHVLVITAKDALHHTTDVPPISFTVDKTPPVLTLTENGEALVDNAILNHDVTPLLTVADMTVVTVVPKLDGNDFTLGNTVTAEGAHVLDISATDALQWPATISRRFFIDKTKPVVTISVGDKLLVSGDEFGGAITPKIDIVDISATTTSATLNGAEYFPGTPITADGTYVLAVTVTDAANWPMVVPPISFAIDTTAPVVKVMENGVPFESGTKFKRDVEPKIIVTDLTRTTIDAKLDGNAYTLDSVISAEGRHTLTVSVTDNLGHVTPVPPIAFLLDKTAPVVSIVAAGLPMKSGDAFLHSVKPEILVTDVSATTVDATLTSAAGVQPFVSGLEITAEGAYTLAVTVTDELGWSTPVPPIDFFVDSTPPVVELLDHHGEVLENNSWYAEAVTPKVTVVDTTPTTVTATLNGQPFNLDTPITAEGTYTLAVTVVDKVGLPTVVPPVTFTIDTTAPAITFLSPPANATLTTREIVVTGDSDDAISVFVNGAQAIIDPADKKYVSPPLSLLEGPNVISAVAYDRAGNKAEPFITVTLDTRGPEITVTSPAADACLNVTQLEVKGTVFGGVSTINVTAGTAAPVAATIDTTARTWTATIQTPLEGKLPLTITGSDGTSHTSSITRQVSIDRTKPVIEVTEGNLAFTATLVNRPVALSVRAKDTDADATLVVTLDDAPYTSGTSIAAEGLHTLKAKATDCAGHVSDEKVLTFRIDRTPPVLSNLSPANGSSIGNKPSITGSVSEPATIVAESTAYTATVTGNAFTIAPALEEGPNAFVLLATDAAGNQSRLPYAVTVRSTAPAVEIVENGAPIAANALFNRDVTPVVRSSDPSATITATLNGAPFTSGTAVTADGSYTVTGKATDTFGHASETATATFRIDKTPPAIDITQPLDGATLPSPTVNVTGTVGAGAQSVSVNGVPATLPGNGTFAATVTLDGFDGTIVAFASDEAGNSASDRVNVTFEGGTLAILLTSPADRLVTNRPRTVVAGQIITPADAESLTVNNTAAAFDAVGSFLIPDFALVEGENPITATVKKIGGQSNSVTVVVTADFTPPVLKVLANSVELAAGARFATSPSIVLEATDNNPGVTTRLTIDGTAVTGAAGALTDGGHSLTAIARDAAGNEARVDRTFFIGNATVSSGCGLSNIDPADQSTSSTALFNGTIQINGRSGGAAAVLINGTRAEVSEGSFCGVATLVEGRNEITIQCANADGTPTTDAPLKVVYYRYVDPVITIASPSGSAPVTEAKVTVTGTVGAGVIEGNVNGIRFTVPNDGAATHNFSVPDVTLAPGLNVISARAQTMSNRGGVATVRVKLLSASPQISITSPLTGTTTGATSVDVSGTYANVDPSTITITAGGTTVAANVNALTDTTGTFRVASVNLPASLRTTITAGGRNAAGVLGTASIEVEQVSTAPQITIAAPADNTFLPSTTTGTIHVTGTINDVPNASVQVNGVAATLTGTSFSADVEQTATAGGSTPIIARVTLLDGRSATDAARVIRLAGPLSVADVFPSNDATDVDPAVVVLAVVSNPLDGTTVAGAFRVADSTNATVPGDLFVDRDAISFAPHQALKRGERYTVTVAQSLKDAAGSALGAAFSSSFTVGTTAPNTPPTLDPIADGCFTDTVVTGRVSNPGARIQLEVDGVKVTRVSNATTGAFEIRVTFSGQPGFHSVRAREVGSDGTMSAERAMCVRISCAAPRVVASSLDRATKTLSIQFSKPMNPATLIVGASGSIRIVPDGAAALSGTLALNGVNDTATITFAEALPATSITLTVTRAAKDAGGAALAADYTQIFTVDGAPPSASGKGYISGAVYDATRGRQLGGATIHIAGEPPTLTNDQGRYASRPLPEGAYTIQASAPGRTTVWRQVVVPVGAGVLPIDIRLTERGPEATANGTAQTLAHGGDTTVTRPVELSVAAASLTTGRKVRLTSVGAQSLAGLLPLGWSPLAAAEIVVDDQTDPTPMPGAKLTFVLSEATTDAIAGATQTLSIVQYDSERDEWRVAVAAASIASDDKVSIDLTASGNYALVYADKATHLTKPAVARSGAALAAVANPCLITPEACLLTKIDFVLNPQAVLPNGRSTATLTTEGAGATQTYPSGTAVQAYIDEELNLADGRVLIDPPFATDLLVYRDLVGTTGLADFHLAPTPQAAAAMLRDGADHIRIVDYPGRIDRGTLIGADGGRVPGDDAVTVDIPSGATAEPLHAAVSSLSASDLAGFGSIPGFRIAGGFNFTLTGTSEPQPVEGMTIGLPQLIKPARATFSVSPIPTAQVIVAEVLSSTPYGVMFRMIAATTASTSVDVPGSKVYTTRNAAAGVPIGGLVRAGRYLILAADSPIAYAYGQVRVGDANGLALANARVISGIGAPMTATLGVAELTRTGGVFVVPVAAAPAAPYSLQGRSVSAGDGAATPAAAAPAADTFVNFGALVLSSQPPRLMTLSPDGSVELDAAAPFAPQAVFDVAIDPSSVAGGLIIRNITAGTVMTGTVSASGATVRFVPSQPLSAATQYSITVAPTIRTLTGAPFGRTVTKQFRTRVRSTNTGVHPELISITIPDASGKSTIHGRAGALPTDAQVIAVRRGRNFIVSYETTVTSVDGSFSFDAGDEDPKDRISIEDDIDLRVLDGISKAVIAVIPLTFASEDGRTLVAVPTRTITVTSVDGISITIEEGTFDVRTPVTIQTAQKTAFAQVPQFDAELNFSGAMQVTFDGMAKKRMQIEMKAPDGASTAKSYFLGYLGQSIRGPRVELADTLRLVNGRFTTTLASGTSAGSISTNARRITTQQVISNPADVKRYLIGAQRSGIYGAVDLASSVGWSLVTGVAANVDMFWDSFSSLFASQFTLTQTRGAALIPVAPDKPFQVVGVDASTGLEQFRKVYSGIAAGDPFTAVVVPAPVDDQVGPYPVFASPARFEVVDTAPYGETLKSVRGLEVTVLGNDVHVKRTEEAGWTEVVNVHQTAMAAGDVAVNAELAVPANQHDRVLISMMAKNVDAFEPVSITFHRPLYVGPSTDPEAVDAYFHSENLIKVEAGDSLLALSPVTEQVEFSMDSQNRRVLIDVNGALQLGRTYRITISKALRGVNPDGTPGLQLAQKLTAGVIGPELSDDIRLYFTTRAPGGQIAEMNLSSGVVRDLGINGNIALVAALTGGIQAFDISDPAALQGTPTPIGKTKVGEDEMWGIASDRHGRIYATGLGGMYGFVHSYRIEDFTPDASGTTKLVNTNNVISTALVCWRVGASAGLPLSTSYVTVSDRPEAIPRKIQVLLQDNELKVDLGPLVDPPGTTTPDPTAIGNGFYQLSVSVAPDPALKYKRQRITVENRTAGLHWSKDVMAGGGSQSIAFLARANDDVYIVRNQMTYGVISLFGYGIGVFDLNAMESNDAPGSTARIEEKVVLTDVKPCQPNPYVPCMASDYEPKCPASSDASAAPFAVPCPIREIYLTPESLISTGPDSSSVNVYALDSYRGVLDVTIEPPKANPAPPPAVLPANVIRHPGLALGRSPSTQQSYHQRLLVLRDLYRTETGREPRPRFQSIAPYLSFDADGNKRDYALVTGRDFGLLVVKLDGAPLTSDHLVDVVWIPAGAVAVRVIPRSDIAVVVDGAGRVLFVNLKQIDESDKVAALPACTGICPIAEMFPTALAAATAATPTLPPGADWFELGADDPRIIWKSAPKTVLGTLAPVIDAETGILFTGDVQATRMRAIAATDPRPRVMVNTGDPAGYRETGAIVPLGIDPPTTAPLSGPDASLSTFRLEVTLPGSITESLIAAGNELRFAIESERTVHAVTGQTPDPYPVAHLRRATATGGDELRPAPNTFKLSRLVPYDEAQPELYKLRFQRGYNRFISPWVVALADPRASARYNWGNWGIGPDDAAAKREHGCPSCKKPAWVTGTAGVDYFEIYSAGRYLAVRPEVCRPTDTACVPGNEYFQSTPYQYLGQGERLVTRVGTVMADSIRPTYVTTAAQAPPVAGGALQETVFTHSGELMTSAVDHDAGGRAGWNVVFDRTYRSRTIGFSPLARGWDSSIFQRLRELPNRHIEYRDGSGEVWEFKPEGGAYKAPTGLYLKLTRTAEGWRLIDQKFRISEFDSLGRLVKQSDEFFNNSGGGNVIRYYYDRDSHLVSIVDPVNRATGLYWKDDRLEKIKDWRDREVFYHYDAKGRLERIELPKAKNPAYPVYDYSFPSSIRNQHYTYEAPSSDYSNGVELDANLLTIREPGDGAPRVTYEYYGTPRDMVHFENWGTSDNAKVKFDFTMPSGTFPSPTKTTVEDALKQIREYTYVDATQPKDYTSDRAHATKVDELLVPVWQAAVFGALPSSVSKNDDDTVPQTRTFKFGFTEGRMTSSSLEGVSSTVFEYDGPMTNDDYVVSSRIVAGLGGTAGLAQEYERDGAFLKRVSAGGLVVDAPEAHKNLLTPTSEDGGVKRTTTLYPTGLVKEVKSEAVAAPALAGSDGEFAKIDYYDANDPEKYRRARPQQTSFGLIGGYTSLITYPSADVEERSIVGRSVNRRTEYDEIGRALKIEVSGTDSSARDEFAYDARGRLVRHKTKQTDTQWLEDRYEYDRVGRVTAKEVWQLTIGTGPAENRLSRTTFDYHMPNREFRATLPNGGPITRKLDGLGRDWQIVSDPENPTYTTLITQTNAYDLDGNLVFSTDGSAAAATRFDAVHRAVEAKRSDGTSSKFTWDDWFRLDKREEVETGFFLDNTFTNAGKLIEAKTNSLTQEFSWDGAGRTSRAISKGGSGQPVRESQLVYDTAGRLKESRFGEQGTTAALGHVFHHASWLYGSVDQPSQLTTYEDNDAFSYKWSLSHDALGRATKVENQVSPDFVIHQTFDQLGNVTDVKTPERRGTMKYEHDARGLTTAEKLPVVPDSDAPPPPAGTPPPPEPKNTFIYDDHGILKSYTDATGEPTDTLNDGLGRPLRRKYDDDSTEELFYIGNRLNKIKDRQNRWQYFDYDATGRLFRITDGSTTLDQLTYHPDGRLFRWQNAQSIVEFDNYDAEGRPRLTKQTRLRPDGTVLDSYTQTHEYNGFGQRTSWTMPGEATFGTGNWTTSVQPRYDAAGNVVELKRVLVNGGMQTLMNAEYRAAGRPKFRTLHTNIGTSTPTDIERKYEYGTDGIGRVSAFRVFHNSSLLPDPILLAGSEVQYEGTKLSSARLLGIANGELTTQWRYDDRGRLAQSVAASTEPVTSAADLADAVVQHFNDADFLKKIDKTAPAPGATDKEFDESDAGHKVEKINASDDVKYKTSDGQDNGSLRTEDGRFHYVYDEKARLRRAILKPVSGATSVMQVTYDYNAAGRMVGRRVEVSNYAGQPLPDVAPTTLAWALATPLQMGPDAVLPANTTFVWDPISDQLTGVFEAERNDGGVTTVGKPIRQYLHGGRGLDDPIEVAVAESGDVARYYPIYDEAGDGGLQAVLTPDAKIVARTILEDPYGDGELAINGPAVDNVTLTATKAGDGTISEMLVEARLTEPIDGSTLPGGGRLSVLDVNNDVIATATEAPEVAGNGYVLRWTVPGSSWTALTSTSGALALSVAVTSELRSTTFGPSVGVLSADTSSSSSIFADDHPFELREPLSLISSRFATLSPGGRASGELYAMTSLTVMTNTSSVRSSPLGRLSTESGDIEIADSASALLLTAVFQAQPFTDPFTLKNYVRARWYDPAAGTWLGPDPKGYTDSSNLYAFTGGDPVNRRDPTGECWNLFNERCRQDTKWVAQEFVKLTLTDQDAADRNAEHIVGGVEGLKKLAVGVKDLALDLTVKNFTDKEGAGDRNLARWEGLKKFADHPIDSIKKTHERAAEEILAREQAGDRLGAGEVAAEIGSADAAAVIGGVQLGAAVARAGSSLLTRSLMRGFTMESMDSFTVARGLSELADVYAGETAAMGGAGSVVSAVGVVGRVHIALGSRLGNLRTLAREIGADHLLNAHPERWQQIFLEHVANPSTKFSVSMDGFWGATAEEMILNEMKSGTFTGWELNQLKDAGRLGTVDFYLDGKLIPNPF